MSEEKTEWVLVVAFSGLEYDQDPEQAYIHGVEFGQIWQRMASGREAEIIATIHSQNCELFERAAAADGWECTLEPSGFDGWKYMTLVKRRPATANPHGLRVI